jgi:hypothetical protein
MKLKLKSLRVITNKGARVIREVFGKLNYLITLKVIFWVHQYYFANVGNDE